MIVARRRPGGTRRGVAAAVAAVLTACGALAGCGNPHPSTQGCVGADESVVSAIQRRMTADGELRNGRLVPSTDGGYSFISAEVHLRSDEPHDSGDIATWASTDPAGGDFVSVDEIARRDSDWDPAPFTVTEPGAIESRACTDLSRGKTPAQVECERRQSLGETVILPVGQSCSDL